MSEFNKKVGKDIPKSEADHLAKRWKDTKPKTYSNFFGSDILERYLKMPNVVGLRFHYGLNEKGEMQPFITPEVDSSSAERQTSNEVFGDSSLGCPPYCP